MRPFDYKEDMRFSWIIILTFYQNVDILSEHFLHTNRRYQLRSFDDEPF